MHTALDCNLGKVRLERNLGKCELELMRVGADALLVRLVTTTLQSPLISFRLVPNST
jgi:hypothetical protein